MNHKLIEIPQLIFKKVTQGITKKEEAVLNNWIEESDEHKIIFEEIVNDENIKQALRRYFNYNTDKAWESVEKIIGSKKTKVISLQNLLKYAAVFAIPLLIGGDFLFQQLNNSSINIADSNLHLKAGTQTATLTLGNGKTVQLGQAMDKKVVLFSDEIEAVDTNSTLIYSGLNNTEDSVVYNLLETPIGGEYTLELTDGTKVWLNAATRIRFPQIFNKHQREVYLEGEAFFEVAHNSDQPFIVHAQKKQVKVLGTSFNINAYNNETNMLTTLVNGKVAINTNYGAGSHVLTPGQQAMVHNETSKITINQVDTYLYTAWKDGLFAFKAESLESIMRKFSRWYNCDIQFKRNKVRELKFTGSLNKQLDLKTVLQIISESCQVEFSVDENNIITVAQN